MIDSTFSRPFETHPPSATDMFLQQKFAEEIVKQNERLDDLAKQLLSLELAIPGIYATALQIVVVNHTASSEFLLFFTFLLWFVALVATIVGLFPLKYKVQSHVIRRGHHSNDSEGISIEEFYQLSAVRKRYALAVANICFFIGIAFAAFTIF